MAAYSWYQEDPARYDRELAALSNAGIAHDIDEKLSASGFIRLYLSLPPYFESLDNFEPLELTVDFPEYYPYFRPEVFAPSLNLSRHQNPFTRSLCLIPRETYFWKPGDTVVDYLRSQLKAVIDKGNITDRETLQRDETEQAEPESEYYSKDESFPVIVDTSIYDGIAADQHAQVLGVFRYGISASELPPLRLAALTYYDQSKNLIGKLPAAFSTLFKEKGQGLACRTNDRPPENPQEFEQWLANKFGGERFYSDLFRNAGTVGTLHIDRVITIAFPEEIAAGEYGWGWLGYVRIRQKSKGQISKTSIYVRVLRANEENFNQRVPRLKPLSDKTVSIIGLGALGAPSAIEFARSGVKEIRIVDYDFVDPATAIRWPLGITYAGALKTTSLKKFIEENYPYTTVIDIRWKIGALITDRRHFPRNLQFEREIMDRILDGTSLIYDASAEVGIMHFLSHQAASRAIPYISIEATQGVYGGQIMRVVPDTTTGCWMCLQYAQNRGNIPQPPKDESGKMQAAGCGDISFTGTSFDLANIYNNGVRLAVTTMCRGHSNAYPDLDWDIGILSLVDKHGNPVAPEWATFSLNTDPECPYCARH